MPRTEDRPAEQHPQRLCKVTDAAQFLALSRSMLYQLMDRGRLPYVKLGKSRRIRWEDVLALIDENLVGGDPSRN
jgi:excisionase family DNA binding protein